MGVQLAQMLREGTKKSHTMAENTGFVACFLKGTVEKNSYRKLVSSLYFVYSAMEEAIEEHRNHPIVSKFYYPQLFRKSSLERDLSYYFGPNWRNEIEMSPATTTYVDRIRRLSQENPILLVAHFYTRYLGDLSGGQILKNIAVKAMGLNDGRGVAFYAFDAIPDEKAFKDEYRQAMNQLPIDEATAQAIVDEANDAFHKNMDLFKELEGNLILAIGKLLFNSLIGRRGKAAQGQAVPAE
jgi:heme oxygenase (biliverdin-producing, ferredoxin)